MPGAASRPDCADPGPWEDGHAPTAGVGLEGLLTHSSAERGVEMFMQESDHPTASGLKEGSWGVDLLWSGGHWGGSGLWS